MSRKSKGIVIKRMGHDYDENWKCNECSFNHPSSEKVYEHMRIEHNIASEAYLRKIEKESRRKLKVEHAI